MPVQPVPLVNGQHAHTHLLPLETTTVVELVALTPASMLACVPGSPEPRSPDVPCHGAGPSSKYVLAGEATSGIVPGATQKVWLEAAVAVWPLTEIEHHEA